MGARRGALAVAASIILSAAIITEVKGDPKTDDPSPPQDVVVNPLSSSSMKVFWQAPAVMTGNLLYYNVSWTPADGELQEEVLTDNFATLIRLRPCTAYYVTVTATAEKEVGEPVTSDLSDAGFDVTQSEAPPPVEDLTGTALNTTSILLTWNPPDTNCAILEYTLFYIGINNSDAYGNDPIDNSVLFHIDGDETEEIVTGLKANYMYVFYMGAINSDGESDAVQENVSTLPEPDTITELTFSPDVFEIQASWEISEPSGEVNRFNVTYGSEFYCLADGNSSSTLESKDCMEKFQNNPLLHCTRYEITVQPMSDTSPVGIKLVNATYTLPDTTIDVPISCTYEAYNSDEIVIHVTWDYVGDCSAKTLNYVGEALWDYQYAILSEELNIFASEGETGYPINDAVPYTKYTFELKIDDWDSNSTYYGNCTTPQLGPSPPQDVTAEPVSDSQYADISWGAPESANGIITQYEIVVTDDDYYQETVYYNKTVQATGDSHQSQRVDNLPSYIFLKAYVRAKTVEFGEPGFVYFDSSYYSPPDVTYPHQPEEGRDSDNTVVIAVSVTVCVLAILVVLGFVFRDSLKRRFS